MIIIAQNDVLFVNGFVWDLWMALFEYEETYVCIQLYCIAFVIVYKTFLKRGFGHNCIWFWMDLEVGTCIT